MLLMKQWLAMGSWASGAAASTPAQDPSDLTIATHETRNIFIGNTQEKTLKHVKARDVKVREGDGENYRGRACEV
jgi:hypothetical protein